MQPRYEPAGETPGFVRATAVVIAERRLARLTCNAINKVPLRWVRELLASGRPRPDEIADFRNFGRPEAALFETD